MHSLCVGRSRSAYRGARALTNGVAGLLAALAFGTAWGVAKSPDTLVRETVSEVQQIVRKDPALATGDRQKTLEIVEQKILPHFDFERMTMLAVGRDWQRATPEQRRSLVDGFRALLVRTYSGAISTYKDYKIDVKPAKESGDTVTVRTQVSGAGAQPVLMDYRMHRTADGWKVHDVAVEGVSLVTTYRSTFKTEIDRGGFDALIKLIASKSAQAASSGSSATATR